VCKGVNIRREEETRNAIFRKVYSPLNTVRVKKSRQIR
jgi:hypothetical protein